MLIPWVAWLAASAPDATPLPGNKQCPYPPQAQERFVAGPVTFTAQVRPDGSVESVDVPVVPSPGLDFADSVKACVAAWRFEPAPASAGLRAHTARLRFNLSPDKEAELRALIEAYAAAWNAGDTAAMKAMALDPEDARAVLPHEPPRAGGEAQGAPPAEARWRMELEPDLSSVQFLEADVAVVRQRYRRHRAGEEPEPNIVEAHAEKTGRGWRLFSVRPGAGAWVSARPGAATIPEPRKLKHVAPDYPEDAQRGRIQGSVFIECVVSPQGKVAELRVLRGIPELNKAALAAVKRWEYTPTLLDGKAVPVTMTVTVNFRLR